MTDALDAYAPYVYVDPADVVAGGIGAVAWAAGLFEGEGCFSHTRLGAVRASLQMTDRDVVERFARIVGVGTVRPQKPSGWGKKQSWLWRTSRNADFKYVLTLFAPWLGNRRLHRALEIDQAYRAERGLADQLVIEGGIQ